MRLLLASSSTYRAAILKRASIPFECVAHQVNERALARAPAETLAERLSIAKAMSVPETDAFILGCDQVALRGETVLGKPTTVEAACEQLARLQGETHQLISGVALRTPDGQITSTACVTNMTMRSLDAKAIARYVERDQPLQCCGSYKFESLGVHLFKDVAPLDETSIVGLPLLATLRLLRDAGFALPF